MDSVIGIHKKSPEAATSGLFVTIITSGSAAVFYFFRPLSHLQIQSYKKFADMPALTEIRIDLSISDTVITSFRLNAGTELAAK